jgi:nucleotide-binding universal stress UspA family protein
MSFLPGYSLLVPTDFTEKTNLALSFASNLIKERGGIIYSLHVVDHLPELNGMTVEAAKQRHAEYVKIQSEKLGVTIIPNIVTGNIFNSIGETAAKLGTNLIIMGVHGMQGIQFVIGSFAARVILGCSIPVILISDEFVFQGFKNIVLPLDMNRKVDKIVSKAKELGLQYGSMVHIFSNIDSNSFIKRAILKAEIFQIINSIKRAGIKTSCRIVYGENSKFVENVLKYSAEINADLIMMALQSRGRSLEFVVGKTENRIMQYSKVPLYIINPTKGYRRENLYQYEWK